MKTITITLLSVFFLKPNKSHFPSRLLIFAVFLLSSLINFSRNYTPFLSRRQRLYSSQATFSLALSKLKDCHTWRCTCYMLCTFTAVNTWKIHISNYTLNFCPYKKINLFSSYIVGISQFLYTFRKYSQKTTFKQEMFYVPFYKWGLTE